MKTETADNQTALEARIRDDLIKLHGVIPKDGGKGWMSASKPILEYKAILNLATLKSDKTEYREWSDKLKNAMLQIRPGSRVFLTEVERCPLMQPEPKVGELTAIFNRHESTIGQTYDQFKTDLYTVLVEKTTGEARERVKTIETEHAIGDQSDGILAYSRVHRWFCQTSGLAVAERRSRVMMPETCGLKAKKDEDLIRVIDVEERTGGVKKNRASQTSRGR